MTFASEQCLAHKLGYRKIRNVKDVEAFYPKTIEEIETRKKAMIEGFYETIEKIMEEDLPTFDNTVRLFDLAYGSLGYGALGYGSEFLESLAYVYPDLEMREAAEKASIEVKKTALESFNKHPELYSILCSTDQENLLDEHRYYLNNCISMLKRIGLNLSSEKRALVNSLKSELTELEKRFSRNIREDRKTIQVSYEELEGMDEVFISGLQQTDEGNYILTTDYPVVFPIMSYCKHAATREKLYKLMHNRAYPENEKILNNIFTKRQELATLLGYESYAALQLEPEMVKTPLKAYEFLDNVELVLREKAQQENALLIQNLPDDVSLSEENKLYPWDIAYVLTEYKKKIFDLDVEALKVYFPMEKVIEGLFSVYESFFNIRIEEVKTKDLWHQDLRLARVSDKETGLLYGFIAMDLFPREGKYTHACDVPTHPSLKTFRGEYPALSLLICNFPKATKDMPSLMRPYDIRVFFHEFGHALHDMLGRTDLVSTAGTNTKYDFVEMPSQILEEWLNDPQVLQKCSSHVQTGEKLPMDIALELIKYRKCFVADGLMRQVRQARFSLDVHSKNVYDLEAHWQKLSKDHHPEIQACSEDHYYASFGHLQGYGARYYGYLWSKVFALDVFEKIKQQGILNPEIGKVYIQEIIGRGGSADPNEYLKNFLGREPSFDAFKNSVE